ncbi:histamine N-methyltransferase A-like [Pelobates fuscus]|uniref:histamine N-methyltransferase A-like n=1 Tax=Pelobates fuscus TaxID=191477 RepID=UPI002FE45B72
MASVMKSLYLDKSRYVEAFRLYIKTSTEHQSMLQFINTKLPEIISSIENEKSSLNILGIGSGSGEIDLQIISKLRVSHPGAEVNNDIVEPSDEQTIKYKERIGKQSGLDNVTFSWYKKTCQEYESQVTNDRQNKKYDLIHMIQVLYYVKDIPATLKFFINLLAPNGKLLIALLSGNSGCSILWKKYGTHLPPNDLYSYITGSEVEDALNSIGAKYQRYELDCDRDITECFVEGSHIGELLLDFLTETCEFKKNAPSDLRDQLLQDLKKDPVSSTKHGKLIFNNNMSVFVVKNDKSDT